MIQEWPAVRVRRLFVSTLLVAIAESALSVNRRLTPSISNSFWNCLIMAFLGSCQNSNQGLLHPVPQALPQPARRPINSGIRPNLIRSSVSIICQNFTDAVFVLLTTLAPNPMSFGSETPPDDLVQPVKSAAADKKDIGGIDFDKILLGMFSAAFGRDTGRRAFNNFQQGLLNAFTGNIPGDGRVVRLCWRFCRFHRCRQFRAWLFRHHNRHSEAATE